MFFCFIYSITDIVIGGYVGLSLGTLLSQKYEVVIYVIDSKKIKMVNDKLSPINDEYIK